MRPTSRPLDQKRRDATADLSRTRRSRGPGRCECRQRRLDDASPAAGGPWHENESRFFTRPELARLMAEIPDQWAALLRPPRKYRLAGLRGSRAEMVRSRSRD